MYYDQLMTPDPRVDNYIARAPKFAQPILEYLRVLIHKGCPDVTEDIKWSRPAFAYRGKMLLSLAAFKAHCSANFWVGPVNRMMAKDGSEGASGSLERVTKLSDLPSKQRLLGYIREACRLIETGALKKQKLNAPANGAPRHFFAISSSNPKMMTGISAMAT